MSIEPFKNTTHNQHFVSQAEQRLNSCSPDPLAAKAEIYGFEIIEKTSPTLRLAGKKRIQRNLAFQDLFTLTRIGKSERLNFERFFERYEQGYPKRVAALRALLTTARGGVGHHAEGIDLQMVEGDDFPAILTHLKFIYIYKMMNWLRNPHQAKEVLRYFASYLNHCIDNPSAFALYLALTEKDSAEEQHICRTYDLSSKEYQEWIRLLLLFLYNDEGEPNLLEGFVEEFFLAKEFFTTILILVLDEKCALLPDTGVVKDDHLATYINVAKDCVVVLQHAPIFSHRLPANELMSAIGGQLSAKLFINSEDLLAGYNQICVKGSASQVFSASAGVCGVEVVKTQSSD